MTFEDLIKEIYDKEPKTFGELIIVSTIGGSNLLYTPKYENEYNIKHRFECILCSMFYHIILIDILYPDIKRRLVMDFMKFIENLISSTELNEVFNYDDFSFSYVDRYSFYSDELSQFTPSSTNIPFRLLNLIYDNPTIFNLDSVKSCKFDGALDTRVPQTINVKIFQKHTKKKLETIIDNIGTSRWS